MAQHRLLIVDDEQHMIWLLRESFKDEFECFSATNQAEAVAVVASRPVDLVILDLRLDKEDGVETLKKIKEMAPPVPVIIMTAYASVPTAVEAMKYGAYDYLSKPFNIEDMRLLIRRALKVPPSPGAGPGGVESGLSKNKIITQNRAMLNIWRLIKKVAPTGASVLITGESGTGKELVARAVHVESPRRQKPFIAVNCAALPENLLESELFGYEEGAFTGARGTKPGKFELAHEGSLLLDEIGDMPLNTQAKILRVLEENAVDRLGSTRPTQVDVRIIASTNKDLAYLVKKGDFREDLYFRLAVFPLVLPPLRDRGEDIPLLAEHLLAAFAAKYGKKGLAGFHPAVLECFSHYGWPGNVRELRNVVEQLAIMADGYLIKTEDIPPSMGMLSSLFHSPPPAGAAGDFSGIKESRSRAEVKTIADALSRCGGNRTKAAEMLGISRRTLQLKIKKYHMD